MHSCYLFCFFTLALMPSYIDKCIDEFIHLEELITSVISIYTSIPLTVFNINGKWF